jgi:UDP-N-acetylglucosamine 2-epimerase (non-hydrolysing)
MSRIDIVAGARPNFMKIAPIMRAIDARGDGALVYRFVHTGQHYDSRLSGDIHSQLGIPAPDVNLCVERADPGIQAAAIMKRYQELVREDPPDICLVVGDVTSTMACAVAARNSDIDVAHVEAGLRSHDFSMPEEINRIVTDANSRWLFTTSRTASKNLWHAGIDERRIHFVGNTMIDTLLASIDHLRKPQLWDDCSLEPGHYFVLTIHRPSNVDDPAALLSLLGAIGASARNVPVMFPAHPRTAQSLSGSGRLPSNIMIVEPQPYLEFNYLVKHARAVVTDSGGITEETTVMGIPCMTLRDSTERPETVTVGTNEVIGTDPTAIARAFDRVFAGEWKKGGIPELWDGRAAERIVAILIESMG